jgi:hypothetical protein
MGNFLLGVWMGCILTIILATCVFEPKVKINEFSIAHNIAHYNAKTGSYVQDSLVFKNDSTIHIYRADK